VASHEVRPGDVLTVTLPRRVVVYKVIDCGTRRGPAPEARLLYEDHSPPPPPRPDNALDRVSGKREPGAGRPTKKERRALDKLTGDDD
jgi:ribosome-associated heat shock protein Hsp15